MNCVVVANPPSPAWGWKLLLSQCQEIINSATLTHMPGIQLSDRVGTECHRVSTAAVCRPRRLLSPSCPGIHSFSSAMGPVCSDASEQRQRTWGARKLCEKPMHLCFFLFQGPFTFPWLPNSSPAPLFSPWGPAEPCRLVSRFLGRANESQKNAHAVKIHP